MLWFGDLNYRIESSVAALEVLGHAVSGGFHFLAANDQLNSTRKAGAAFEGFHEGKARVGGSVFVDAGIVHRRAWFWREGGLVRGITTSEVPVPNLS